jgi:hypothetical protein
LPDQLVLLEHQADAGELSPPPLPGKAADVDAVDLDRTALGGLQPSEAAKQG